MPTKTGGDPEVTPVGVVGGGSWGTALANLLALKGYNVDLWVFEPEVAAQIADRHENRLYLPDIELSANLRPSTELARVVADKKVLLMVVPSHVMRQTARQLAPHLSMQAVVVSASKGIENDTQMTMTEVLAQELGQIPSGNLAVLSGPSFAREVARRVPTAISVAARDAAVAAMLQRIFVTDYFRVYTNDDLVGTQLGGAVKNVIAIAAGIVDGLGLGLNTRAALITRGLTELRRLGVKMGASPRTFTGLAGIGDLLLTCTGTLSRNHSVGERIGRGEKLDDIIGRMDMVAEGVKTARSIYNLSRRLEVEMPICHEVYHVLYDGRPPREALIRLMTRELKQELDEQ
jgi:glycerol-3-phosphate dehydrogenase (NAD(P)+)